MRHHLLLPLCLLAAACAPGVRAHMRVDRDPVSDVRLIRTRALLAEARHRVLDTVAVKLRANATDWSTEIDLRLAAAALGANAVAFLDTVGVGKGTRVRGIALRVEDTWTDTSAHCVRGGDAVPRGTQLRACERMVAADTADAVAWRRLAELRHGASDSRGEREAWAHVVRLVPGDASAWYALGRATRGKDAERWAAWRRAAALDSSYVAPRLALGADFAHDRKRAVDALPWLDEAVRLGAKGDALYEKGRALLLLERWQEAQDTFLAAADSGGIKPTWAYGAAAYALSRAGRHAEAVALWDRVLALDSSWFSWAMREYGMIRDEKSAWKRSRKALGR